MISIHSMLPPPYAPYVCDREEDGDIIYIYYGILFPPQPMLWVGGEKDNL